MRKDARRSLLIGASILLWGILVGIGYASLLSHLRTPGPAADAPARWPGSTILVLDSKRPTLIMFLHPRCPCSTASQAELARVLDHAQGKVSAILLSYSPEFAPNRRVGTERDGRLENTRCLRLDDPQGMEAERFRVKTSGQVLLYGPAGDLLFQGGITAGRGHEGSNPGEERLLATILDAAADIGSNPVYGCPILAAPTALRSEVER